MRRRGRDPAHRAVGAELHVGVDPRFSLLVKQMLRDAGIVRAQRLERRRQAQQRDQIGARFRGFVYGRFHALKVWHNHES